MVTSYPLSPPIMFISWSSGGLVYEMQLSTTSSSQSSDEVPLPGAVAVAFIICPAVNVTEGLIAETLTAQVPALEVVVPVPNNVIPSLSYTKTWMLVPSASTVVPVISVVDSYTAFIGGQMDRSSIPSLIAFRFVFYLLSKNITFKKEWGELLR